jgi:hypothetical protein
VQRQEDAPIRFEELVCSTLATLRIDESVSTGKRLSVDTAAFLDAAKSTPIAHSSLSV